MLPQKTRRLFSASSTHEQASFFVGLALLDCSYLCVDFGSRLTLPKSGVVCFSQGYIQNVTKT